MILTWSNRGVVSRFMLTRWIATSPRHCTWSGLVCWWIPRTSAYRYYHLLWSTASKHSNSHFLLLDPLLLVLQHLSSTRRGNIHCAIFVFIEFMNWHSCSCKLVIATCFWSWIVSSSIFSLSEILLSMVSFSYSSSCGSNFVKSIPESTKDWYVP